MKKPILVWFRHDLRLADNPALDAAAKCGAPVVPVFIWSPAEESPWEPGSASRWWLHQSLRAFNDTLRELDSSLIIRRGPTLEALETLAKETGAGSLFWNRRYEPAVTSRDTRLKDSLQPTGLQIESFNSALLHEPWTIRNTSGKSFQVFTAFWKHCLARPDPVKPLPAPRRLEAPVKWPKSIALEELELEPGIDWASGMRAAWQPGEAGASAGLKHFLKNALEDYADQRNFPGCTGTSRLSPHLHFGEISPRQIWHSVRQTAGRSDEAAKRWRESRFPAELGWREFAHHLLHNFPHTTNGPLREEFKRFSWRTNPAWLQAWQQGRTGFPIVDAGMRELWTTGWMHNRVRMIVASFLVKDLRISWQEGARWFWDTLVDADLANNTSGWQWTAGCGADAAPFFRVFNPASQGQKFDARGDYVRRWCPELAFLPDKWIHQPDKAPPEVLRAAAIEPGRTYPEPIVSHAIAREVALEAFAGIRSSGTGRRSKR